MTSYWVATLTLAALALGTIRPAASQQNAKQGKPIRALLVIGGCCHDYGQQKDLLTRGISERANVEWTIAYDADTSTKHLNPIYEKADWANGFDVVVHDECSADVKELPIIERILKPHRDGVPAVVLHCGEHCYRSEGFPAVTPWFEFTGLQSTGHGPQLPISITYSDSKSPITQGLKDWTTVNEELYNNSAGKLLDTARALATGKQVLGTENGQEKSAESVVVWTNIYQAKTRVFSTTIGHNNATVSDARYLDLVTRGLFWAVKRGPK